MPNHGQQPTTVRQQVLSQCGKLVRRCKSACNHKIRLQFDRLHAVVEYADIRQLQLGCCLLNKAGFFRHAVDQRYIKVRFENSQRNTG